MKERNNKFPTQTLVMMALLASISYVSSLFSFPIFPVTPYFKLDFGNVFILLAGFMSGPVPAVFVCILKELISMLTTSSGCVGELANIVTTCSYILLPSIIYRYKKGLTTVTLSLSGACILGTIAALLANYFVIFPLYMGDAAAVVFKDVFWFMIAFNLIKTVSVSLITLLLYKQLSGFIKTIFHESATAK